MDNNAIKINVPSGGDTENNTPPGSFIDPKVQQELNTPWKDNVAINPADQAFLNLLIGLINDKKIGLYNPDSLINREVYDKSSTQDQGKADFEAVNMLSAIREIKGLHEAGYDDSYQIIYLVNKLRLSKERMEGKGGDLFII